MTQPRGYHFTDPEAVEAGATSGGDRDRGNTGAGVDAKGGGGDRGGGGNGVDRTALKSSPFVTSPFGDAPQAESVELVAVNLLFEYILGSATVARGFTAYLSSLAGLSSDALLLPPGSSGFQIDLPAVGMAIAMAALVGWGVRQAACANTAITTVVLLTIVLILAAGFAFVHASNYHPFAPYGVRGILKGASRVFFAFIGFDMLAVAAEEAREPSRDVPVCILASLAACTAIYVLMAAAITGMMPAAQLDPAAPFARAFQVMPLVVELLRQPPARHWVGAQRAVRQV
ncbi:Cationic amino acid transporter 1 [Tetrabaena socialis]|uniref:Cationic amino acid transporter 1 n=1 Tax=Tetrabaena socialis TaxID=47790 RepID=A0A2J7ZV81_9CHLO|nr:Cationic amino acid transporter 1 [Tetrabaena socialis]|eukprot:PNH04187.1 Cationic amino acid transporter 1 [Tetrabaena socialis]